MIHSAEVFLWGTRIGVVSLRENDSVASFRYDDNFIKSGIEISPLVMPLSSQIYSFPALNPESFKGLPGMLADSLPDAFGDAIVDCWLKNGGYEKENMSAVERLCYTGSRGMGALEFIPSSGPKADEKEGLDIAAMISLAEKVLAHRTDLHIDADDASMASLLKFGTSAGGARAKAVIAWNETTGDICSGQTSPGNGYTYWIIKFDDVKGNGDHGEKDSSGYTRVEYAYSLMAKDAGINMTDCHILKDDNGHHFMTKRFDRGAAGNGKLHMQTLGAIAHLDYKQPGCCSYEYASEVCRRLGLKQSEAEELFRRMVFNVLAKNCDDHVKNISFLMDRSGKWSLSPAYDLCFSYRPDSIWVSRHQMTINGRRDGITHDDILSCAENMGVSRRNALKIKEQVAQSVADWMKFAAAADVPDNLAEYIDKTIKN